MIRMRKAFWILLHNCVAHPILGVATALHDWSADRAYNSSAGG